jgi:hypothetical protein
MVAIIVAAALLLLLLAMWAAPPENACGLRPTNHPVANPHSSQEFRHKAPKLRRETVLRIFTHSEKSTFLSGDS